MNRRDWLRAAAMGAAATLVRSGRRGGLALAAPTNQKTGQHVGLQTGRPRFFLQIIPDGGIDPVWCIDPKTTREVEPGIDVPYKPNEIVDTKHARLSPSFKPLAKWTPRLSLVNAVMQNSANHFAGLIHTTRFKARSSTTEPTCLDILGSRRGDESLGAVTFGYTLDAAYSPKYIGEPAPFGFGHSPGLFEYLDKADSDDLSTLARALVREANGISSTTGAAGEISRQNLHDAAGFLERVAQSPRFEATDWQLRDLQGTEAFFGEAKDLQRVLWLFENRLTRCVTLSVSDQAFDSHIWNPETQGPQSRYLATVLERFLSELDRRKVDGVTLADQTVVVMGSEIGRFPRINAGHGKDHFPQAPYLFFGRWFAPGTFGATDRQMIARPISLTSGKPEKSGHRLRLDDIGTMLLTLDGANPEVYGYSGENLRFLTG